MRLEPQTHRAPESERRRDQLVADNLLSSIVQSATSGLWLVVGDVWVRRVDGPPRFGFVSASVWEGIWLIGFELGLDMKWCCFVGSFCAVLW